MHEVYARISVCVASFLFIWFCVCFCFPFRYVFSYLNFAWLIILNFVYPRVSAFWKLCNTCVIPLSSSQFSKVSGLLNFCTSKIVFVGVNAYRCHLRQTFHFSLLCYLLLYKWIFCSSRIVVSFDVVVTYLLFVQYIIKYKHTHTHTHTHTNTHTHTFSLTNTQISSPTECDRNIYTNYRPFSR